MSNRQLRRIAGIAALAYVAVQAFQTYVFAVLPAPTTPADELMQGAEPLHLVRSTSMLFAMFALIFIYGVICVQRLRTRPVLAVSAFLCFFMFGMLEIGLRSTELFWTQVALPAEYAATHSPAILERLAVFQAIQGALYFPLSIATLLGSIAIIAMFETPPRINYVIKVIAALNAMRIAARTLTAYAGVPLFPTASYERFYFVMVVVFYVPAAYWLFTVPDEPSSA
jgi:hypothetical protein